MRKVKHMYVYRNEDEMKKKIGDFAGGWEALADFVTSEMNDLLPLDSQVINIESSSGVDEVRPEQCNSGTWYKCKWIQLSVWYY